LIQDIFPHRYDVTYKNIQPSDCDILLIFSADSILCRKEKDEVIFPTVKEITDHIPNVKEKARFLFRIDHTNYFDLPGFSVEPFETWSCIPKEEFREIRPALSAFTAVTAWQIQAFYKANTFCGSCGVRMQQSQKERAMICPDCKRIVYPQICPSVIVGITNGEKLLVTRYANRHSKFRRYALVAGYNEVGETLEDTVRREVMEEVGLKVKNIRYFKSQPWSFTGSLLTGFFCEVDGNTDITLDTNELSEALWLNRKDIPDESADPTVSLTGTMMYHFKHSI